MVEAPASAQEWCVRAASELRAGRVLEGVNACRQALSLDPASDVFAVLDAAAKDRKAQTKLVEATEIYRQATLLVPGSWKAWLAYGGCLTGQPGGLVPAQVALTRAVELNKASAPAWSELGRVYLQLNEPGKAREAYEKVTVLEPGGYAGWCGLADARELAGEADDAVKARNSGRKAAPQLPEAWSKLGDTLDSTNRPELAVKAYEKSLELDPGQQTLKVKVQGLRRRLASVPASPSPAAEPSPAPSLDARTLDQRAQVASGRADHEGALRMFRQAVQLEPTNFMYWLHLGMQYARAKDERAAVEVFQRMIDREPKNRTWATGFLWYAEVNEKIGEYRTARDAYTTVLRYHPQDPISLEGYQRAVTMLEQETRPAPTRPRVKREVNIGGFRLKLR